jgi:hypothetical protein
MSNMKPLYICNLEVTTGIYNSGSRKFLALEGNYFNDKIFLRGGFLEMIKANNEGSIRLAVISRSPKSFVSEIQKNLKERGINFDFPIYFREDIDLTEDFRFNSRKIKNDERRKYNNYEKIYKDFDVLSPSEDVVVLGSFIRFPSKRLYSQKDFNEFSFSSNKGVLSDKVYYSLNEHPLPREEETPLYVVLPKPCFDYDLGIRKSLDMGYVSAFLDRVYGLGDKNFKTGMSLIKEQLGKNEFVTSSDLSMRVLGEEIEQDYLIMKGDDKDWKPLVEIM